METIDELVSKFPRAGRVDWIGIRPERKAPVNAVQSVEIQSTGLVGDHRQKEGPRAVTLIQAEHLPVIASLAGLEALDPAILRRNIVVSGINLVALRHSRIQLGSVIIKGTELCPPCSRMEAALGEGGYNAMRGHGGICAAVVEGGVINVGDKVSAIR
ncbi:MAG: MOSC domain-containing protein [Pseudomonadota bacterium]